MARTVGWFAHKAVVSMFLVAGLVTISGCDGGDAGTQTPSISGSAVETSSTPTPTPTPTAYVPASEKAPAQNVPVPVMPEAAKQQTKEGWEAFAKYFIEELNYMVETNDPSRVEKLSVGDCDFCRTEIDFANFANEQKQWAVGGRYAFESARTQLEKDRLGNVGGTIVISRAAGSYVDIQGPLNDVAPSAGSQWYLQLSPTSDGWMVFQFDEIR